MNSKAVSAKKPNSLSIVNTTCEITERETRDNHNDKDTRNRDAYEQEVRELREFRDLRERRDIRDLRNTRDLRNFGEFRQSRPLDKRDNWLASPMSTNPLSPLAIPLLKKTTIPHITAHYRTLLLPTINNIHQRSHQ